MSDGLASKVIGNAALRIGELEAQNKRYREALEQIVFSSQGIAVTYDGVSCTDREIELQTNIGRVLGSIAQAALKDKE